MRTQEQRDMQTLDVTSAFFVRLLVWFVPFAALDTIARHYGVLGEVVRVAFALAFVAYVVKVAVQLRPRSRRTNNVSGHHN